TGHLRLNTVIHFLCSSYGQLRSVGCWVSNSQIPSFGTAYENTVCRPLLFSYGLRSRHVGLLRSGSNLWLQSLVLGASLIGIENARRIERLDSENQRLRAAVSFTHDMVGSSARMREVYQFIERAA